MAHCFPEHSCDTACDLVDAGMAFPANPAGAVTGGVASLADAGMVTVAVTDLGVARAALLADAGMAFPADPAGIVTVGATSLADAGIAFLADLAGDVTMEVASLADAGMAGYCWEGHRRCDFLGLPWPMLGW